MSNGNVKTKARHFVTIKVATPCPSCVYWKTQRVVWTECPFALSSVGRMTNQPS